MGFKIGDKIRVKEHMAGMWAGECGVILGCSGPGNWDWYVKLKKDNNNNYGFNESEIEHYFWWKFWR